MAYQRSPQKFIVDTEEKLAKWTGDIDEWNKLHAVERSENFQFLFPGRPTHPILRGSAALALWQSGLTSWNTWVKSNPYADVDFSHQKIEANAKGDDGAPVIDFSHYTFPSGEIIFGGTIFLGCSVKFYHTRFGDSDVKFDDAIFNECNVNFVRATFGRGNISFKRAQFSKGYVSFDRTTFVGGNVNFDDVEFDEVDLSFDSAIFGKGIVSFRDVSFGAREVSFRATRFVQNDVWFDGAKLGKGNLRFSAASFGHGAVSLRNLSFEGVARFDGLLRLENCTEFSFEGCSFDKLFTFSHEGRMGCPLDLRRTKLSHGVVLNDVRCDYTKAPVSDWTARLCNWLFAWPPKLFERQGRGKLVEVSLPSWPWLAQAADRQDSQRFRRLKELAISENNRAKALEFNAQELRSQRGHESHPLQDFLQFFYMLLSDYGRSVVRPLVALVVVTGLFAALYAQLSTKLSFGDALPAALTYSGGNMFRL